MPSFKHENIVDDNYLQVFFDTAVDENFICTAHWHSHLEILLVLSGSMVAYSNSQKYILGPSDMLVITPNDIHSTYIDKTITYILLQIPADYISRILPDYALVHFQEYFPASAGNPHHAHLSALLLTIKQDYDSKEKGYELHFTSTLFQLLFELYKYFSIELSSIENAKNSRDINRIEEAIRYVRLHYTESISLSDISDFLGISREYFCRLFKDYTGQTFLEYINTFRIVHFYTDLVQTSESITYLMEKHGITNYKVFMKLFKGAYHGTPLQIRKSLTIQGKGS